MSTEVAGLRLQLAHVLWTEGRADDAMIEARTALTDTDDVAVRQQGHQLLGDMLARNSRLIDALGHWITALGIAPTASTKSAVAAAQVLEGPRSEALARQLGEEQLESLHRVAHSDGSSYPSRLLWHRVQRLRGQASDLPLPPELPLEFESNDEIRALVADEYAAVGELQRALSVLEQPHPATAPRALAARARLLIRLGRAPEVLTLDVLPELPLEDPAVQSMVASRALALLADGRAEQAATLLEPYRSRMEVEPRLAAVVLALAMKDFTLANTVLVGLESMSGRSDDIRVMRAQLHLEEGNDEGIQRGIGLLARFSSSDRVDRRAPMWLELQRAVRAGDPRFDFMWVLWLDSQQTAELSAMIQAAASSVTMLTISQQATLELIWGRHVEADQPAAAAEHFAKASELWGTANAPVRRLEAARLAHDLDSSAYSATLANALIGQAQTLELQDEPPWDDIVDLARQAWELHKTQEAGIQWALAVIRRTYQQPEPEAEQALRTVYESISSLETTVIVASYRGWVLSRLGEIAAQGRIDAYLAASEWLLAAALGAPDDPFNWTTLAWTLASLGAYGPGLRAAETARSISSDDPSALAAVIVNRLGQFGTGEDLSELLVALEQSDESMSQWTNAVRLATAMLDDRLDDVPALLEQVTDEESAWIVETAAEARLITGAAMASELAERSVKLNAESNALGSAARMEILQGHLDKALELAEQARSIRTERPHGAWLVTIQARTLKGDLEAATEWHADIENSVCPGDLRYDSRIDLRLLRRMAPPNSSIDDALAGLDKAYSDRLAALAENGVISPGNWYREVSSPLLFALTNLWYAETDSAPWTELDALANAADDLATPPHAIAEMAARAVRDRAASRLLAKVELRAGESVPALLGVEQIAEWVEAISANDTQAEARAMMALQLLLTESTSLDDAISVAGMQADVTPEWLVRCWTVRVPDVATWWQLYDLLETRLSADVWPQIRMALLDRLTELAGVKVSPSLDPWNPHSVLLGPSLVPAEAQDNPSQWVMLRSYIPAIRESVAARTGVEVAGFNLRYDEVLDHCVTYVLGNRVSEFLRLPRGVRVEQAAPGAAEVRLDPVTGQPLQLVPDSSLTSPDQPDRSDNGLEKGASLTWLVARHLLAWVEVHLSELYFPYHVNEVARARPDLMAALDDPAAIITWLDLSRSALDARRKLDPEVLAGGLTTQPGDGDEPLWARVVADLNPWPPAFAEEEAR